ncbi:MAG: site-specific DNA-methyltransferase [Firmicutes bacterium]|nr:site-specific DNA-methyltransferase [Bacillota bacterium]
MDDIKEMDLESKDLVTERIEQMKALFPEIATEGDGSIDFEKLRLILGDEVDEGDERYAFTWPGKADAIRQAQTVSTATLRPCPEESVDWDSTQNLYIEGDNLEVLKLLQRGYHGKVKMIYIDPPYNTGSDLIYEDSFEDPIENFKNQSGLSGQSNADMSGRFHSAWCSMLYPRLKLARELLADDGFIFMSIDEIEETNLKKLADEIFGQQNFLGTIVWNKRVPKNDSNGIGNIHEYVLVYSKSPIGDTQLLMEKDGLDAISALLLEMKMSGIPIPEAEKRLKAFYKEKEYDRGITLYNCLDDDYRPWGKINMSWPNADTFGPRYDVIHPTTGMPVKVPDRGWRWKKETFDEQLNNGPTLKRYDGSYVCGSIWFAQDENTQPSSIKYLEDVSHMLLRSILSLKSDGGIEVENIFEGKSFFSYPKPTSLLRILFDSVQDRNGIYLDFFSGSGSSADALMQLNASDGGQRKMISVQLPEKTDPKTIAAKAGYDDLCEIGIERIKRAAASIRAGIDTENRQLRIGQSPKEIPDLGFRVLKLDNSGITRPEPGQLVLDRVKPERSDEDIIFEMMLKWGLELTYPIEKTEIGGYPCYSVAGDALICCMSEGLTVQVIQEIADMEPDRVLMLDSILDDTLKLNALQIFKRTEEKTQKKIDLRTV